MSGVGITGLIANLPGTVTPYPTQDPNLELGGWRSVTDIAARNAIPANFRVLDMQVAVQADGSVWQLHGGLLNADWVQVQSSAGAAFIIRASLADLVARDDASLPNGCTAYVIDQQLTYTLDTTNAFAVSSPLIVARGAGTGRWFRKSKAYVVGNFTMWTMPFGGPGPGSNLASLLLGFTPGQLLVSDSAPPDIILTLDGSIDPTLETVETVTTDNLGNPWVFANIGNGIGTGVKAYKFLLPDCLATGTPAASVVVTAIAPLQTEGYQGVFDKLNNLIIGVGGHGGLNPFVAFIYKPSTYAQSCSTPDIVMSCRPSGFSGNPPGTSLQSGMAVDSDNNLWIGSSSHIAGAPNDPNGCISMFTPSQRVTSATNVIPAFQWFGSNLGGPGVGATFNVAFGPDGLLWVADYPDSLLRAWDPRAPVSGNPAPVIVLSSTTFNGPFALAFDPSGNLWLNNVNDSLVYRLNKADLAASGAVVPDVIKSAAVLGPAGSDLTFPNNQDRSGLLPSGSPITP